MPLYEYQCDNCGYTFEKIQSVNDQPIQVCPNCAASRVRKVFHPAGIIFKGSGWYVTDSRKSSSSESKSTSGTSGEKKAETKTETKPSTDSKEKT